MDFTVMLKSLFASVFSRKACLNLFKDIAFGSRQNGRCCQSIQLALICTSNMRTIADIEEFSVFMPPN